jgi:uncharacterized protein
MPQFRSLDRITIESPCNADWDSMAGNNQVRFCEHCSLQVTNLSTMTRQQAMRLVARSQGRVCVRFIQEPDGRVLTRSTQKLYRIGRRVSRLAAGAMTAALSMQAASAQTRSASDYRDQIASISQPNSQPGSGSTVAGVITDPNGAVVAGAKVTLASKEGHIAFTFPTGDDGGYRFAFLEPGSYALNIEGGGFAPVDLNVEILRDSIKSVSVQMQLPVFVAVVQIEGTIEISNEVQGGISFRVPQEPLVKAAYEDDLEAIRQLIYSSPDVNVRDRATHMTALDQAVENSNVEMVHALLLAGAWVNARSETGSTALMYLREKASPEMVRELISVGALVNEQNESGTTALINAASLSNSAAVKELLAAGARTDAKDNEGKNALMHAAANEDLEIIKLLIDARAAIDEKDQDGKTALMIAADEGDPDTVPILIQAGAQINQLDNRGWSALMFAVNVQDVESVDALLNAGADVTVTDKQGKTALTLALETDNDPKGIVKLLKSRGAPE